MRMGDAVWLVFFLAAGAWAQDPAPLRAHDERTAAEAAAVRAAVAERRYFVFPEHLPSLEVQRRMSRRFFGRPELLARRVAHTPVHLGCLSGVEVPPHPTKAPADGDRSPAWPAAIVQEVAAEKQRLTKLHLDFAEGKPVETGAAWHGTLLDGADLYVVYWLLAPGLAQWTVFWHDAESGRLVHARDLDARWFSWRGQDCPPMVQQVDLDGDGRMEVAFPMHSHNGTVDDADWLFYFAPGKDRLERVLALRTDSRLPVVSHGEVGHLRTLLLHEGPLSLRVLSFYDCPSFPGPQVPVGEFWLSRKDRMSPFVEERTEPWLTGAENFLGLPSLAGTGIQPR